MGFLASYMKFFVKMRLVAPLRSFFLYLSGPRLNINNWENRLLLINLEALGDLVVFTSVLKHYKKRFPEKKIYLLIKQGTGLENIFSRKFADEVTTVDYRRFAVDPFYGAMFIGRLRSVGFEEVIDHDFSASEIMGKIISVSVGAREVIGYEGIDPEFVHPFDVQQRKNLELVFNKIYPRYTKIIPSVDGGTVLKEKLPSAVSHYVAIYEGATGFKESDYATELPMGYSHQASEGEEVLRKFGLKSGEYAVMNLNASVAYKRWPLGNFKKVADRLSSAGLDVVLIGSRGEELLADEFRKTFPLCLNLAGKTDLRELLSLIGGSFVVVSNDTSIVHIAVALRKPSLCVTGGGQFGMFALYGYGDINKWVYKTTPCFCDNWQCGLRAKVGEPSPCLAAVSVGSVLDELDELLRYLKKNKNYPREKFSVGADVERGAKISGGRRGIKVLYAGTEFENYDPLRRGSFEYANFYSTLKNMKGVEVVDYPFDRILGMGKKRFNDKLLRLVERERPDLFFAFMYTDELEPRVLMEIKKRTKSVAWFADDYWRFFNYSRHWPPYFTKIVTTYSRAVDWYKKAGYDNVVLSQWACNTAFYKPVAASKDIDVSFVGQMKSGRMRVVEALHRAGIDVQCFGFGWPGGRVSHDEAPRIIGRSKICLNLTDRKELWDPSVIARLFLKKSADRIVPDLHFVDNFRAYVRFPTPHTHARPFELSGCEAFVVSGRSEDIGKYYAENEEMIFYDDIPDLIGKIRYYLSHDGEREKIADAGYGRTMREHTYENRFLDIFADVGLNYIRKK